MSIEWLRDLVVCIFGIGATLVIICVGVLAFVFYFRVKPILDSVKKATKTVENITTSVEEEVVKPIVQVAAFVQGMRQAVGTVSRFTRRQEGGRDDQ